MVTLIASSSVSKGIIVQQYGKIKHPIFKGVETYNNGVDIATNKNAVVRTVFDGVVSRIFFIKGSVKAVLINHGEYYTLYAKLKNLKVEKGDIIKEGQIIADLVTNNDGITQLQFQIWKNNIKLNPENWIIKK